ncbi:UbiA prenyltransferase family-domain-containing protein [Annulohypoxylon maeteangense]|uniref:UbiA prenyltransferase family-domain-containing protein n=1 Tax=Annulohypoxylon maeteangense TaxID=1927788 RepID=UPI0020079810|nr:UbiA prenyltransferase family-domain-containing protein [Annulohypoxylon maeteangense]KAI0887575.1 UbiA prenyltransferase family-domain-containing protein [Annulohypoxylon maeteangense]
MGDNIQPHPEEQYPSIEGETLSLPSPTRSKFESHDEPPTHIRESTSRLGRFFKIFWLLTESNALTFVGPNTIFGICGALSGPWIVAEQSGNNNDEMSKLKALARLGLVILFNWSNLFIFDLANQRLPESVVEDALNKPWRPVPSGFITTDHIRCAMLYLIPLVVAFNHFALGVGIESLVVMVLTWLYNDLRGGDEGYIARNAIIAAAFMVYNTGSVKVAVGARDGGLFAGLSSEGVVWAAMVSATIFTTMQVQDLQDVKGDRVRGRRSAPIIMGDRLARWSVAAPMFVWPAAGAWLWGAGLALGGPQVTLGALVAVRCLWYSGLQADKLTWRLWCLWTAMLYTLPPLCYYLPTFRFM